MKIGVALVLVVTLLGCEDDPADILMGDDGNANGHAEVIVKPTQPTAADDVSITISGLLPHPCFGISSSHVVRDGLIEVSVEIVSLPGVCVQVVTPWSVTERIGQLPAGDYQVIATIHAPCCFPCDPSPCVEQASFLVTEQRRMIPAAEAEQ